MKRTPAPIVAVLLVVTVAAANWVTTRYGLVPAGFGLLVTAGTYFAGISLGLRDLLQQVGGICWALAAVAAGIAVSFLMGDGRIALASAVAFGLGELADLFVYTPIRRRNWRPAVVVGNAIGALVDTLVFLSIAGFPLTGQSVGGQMLVKGVWCTALALVVGEGIARTARRVMA